MRLQTASHPQPGSPAGATPGTYQAEQRLLAAVLVLVALAALLPASALPAGYHHFADQRAWGALPHAMDVLSNLPFALIGAWGLAWLRRLPAGGVGTVPRVLAGVFLGGLGLTAVCSSVYHWAPDNANLCLDRLGMSAAFAGLLGLAAADRIGARAGVALAAAVTLAAPTAALFDVWAGNMTPWAVLQGGGLLLLVGLALRPARAAGALGFSIAAVIAFYALAKVLELVDQPVFELTQGLLSGHSAKHLVAACAAWPVVRALRRAALPTAAGAAITMR